MDSREPGGVKVILLAIVGLSMSLFSEIKLTVHTPSFTKVWDKYLLLYTGLIL